MPPLLGLVCHKQYPGRTRRNIFAPELCTKKAMEYQWLNFGAEFLIFAQTIGCLRCCSQFPLYSAASRQRLTAVELGAPLYLDLLAHVLAYSDPNAFRLLMDADTVGLAPNLDRVLQGSPPRE